MNYQAMSINPIGMFNCYKVCSGIRFFFNENSYFDSYRRDTAITAVKPHEADCPANADNEPGAFAITDPVNDIKTICFEGGSAGPGLKLLVYSSLGSRQYVDYELSGSNGASAISFSSSHLLPGIYYYIVTADDNKWSGSFVVAR